MQQLNDTKAMPKNEKAGKHKQRYVSFLKTLKIENKKYFSFKSETRLNIKNVYEGEHV